ncbi:Rhamnogalacturonan Acetylesterase [Delphinella strobiligena]|nr:Rhamnogalacturonan Acetylesterase [Delphinella strobiligena]
MHVSTLLVSASLSASASALKWSKRATTPTLYMAGDSTMALGGGGTGTQGWGEYIKYSLSIPVVNDAKAGRSARSYTREGRFDTITNTVQSGDFVIIEFGHNDGASNPDNGRSDCPGSSTEVCTYTYDNAEETVYTFPQYLEWAAANMTAKGATVIISSQTPNNPDETGAFVDSPARFVALAQTAASTADVDYVDHNAYAYQAYKKLSVSAVNAMYPNDHTHTSPEAAALMAQSFIRGLVCGDSTLKSYVVNATSSIEGSCA